MCCRNSPGELVLSFNPSDGTLDQEIETLESPLFLFALPLKKPPPFLSALGVIYRGEAPITKPLNVGEEGITTSTNQAIVVEQVHVLG